MLFLYAAGEIKETTTKCGDVCVTCNHSNLHKYSVQLHRIWDLKKNKPQKSIQQVISFEVSVENTAVFAVGNNKAFMGVLNGSWHYTTALWRNINTDSVYSIGAAQASNTSPNNQTLPPRPRLAVSPPLCGENENWTEVFVIKYIQGNSRKWT